MRACFPLELDLFFPQSSMVREGGQKLGRAPAKTRIRETGRKKMHTSANASAPLALLEAIQFPQTHSSREE